jgi:hypothetical protein
MKQTFKLLLLAALTAASLTTAEAQLSQFGRHAQRGGQASQGTSFLDITEFGYAFGTGDFRNAGHISFYEIFLVQFSPRFGLGMGAGANYYTEVEGYNMPLFGMVRLGAGSGWATFFADARLGYSLGDIRGLYFMPTVGVRFGEGRAFTVSLGYEMQRFRTPDAYGDERSYTVKSLSLRLGYEL